MKFHKLALSLAVAAMAVGSVAAHATPITWNITGPGTVSATENAPGDWTMSYNDPNYNFATDVYNVTGVAAAAGDYTFNWDYSGFHSWFQATQSLTAIDPNAGNSLLTSGAVSGGFNYTGTYTFAGVQAGDTLGFQITGSNFDSSRIIQGSLNLQQLGTVSAVPEPSSVALMGLGLAMVGAVAGRRRKGN